VAADLHFNVFNHPKSQTWLVQPGGWAEAVHHGSLCCCRLGRDMMDNCIFCKIIRGEAKSWKVFENERVYAFLDIHPASEYHTLVIPKAHYENMFDIPEKELLEVMAVVRNLVRLYSSRLDINNVQIINSSGPEAQQDVFHLHFHIVPRKSGDRQNVRWTTHPEWVEKYDQMLEKIK
jgi:histidine triad (HIT) family protein